MTSKASGLRANITRAITAFGALAFLFIVTACGGSEGSAVENKNNNQANFVEVVDFHTTHRCYTCNTIEEKTRKALMENFAEELENGTLVFRTVNVDEKENYQTAAYFEAAGTALFVHLVRNGEGEKTELTDFAFMNATAEGEKFENGVKEAVSSALSKL
ncbi:MAG: nitrophenyl compound nitroreductase subunit ArsF family protein [Luteibaculaceae bacterium]